MNFGAASAYTLLEALNCDAAACCIRGNDSGHDPGDNPEHLALGAMHAPPADDRIQFIWHGPRLEHDYPAKHPLSCGNDNQQWYQTDAGTLLFRLRTRLGPAGSENPQPPRHTSGMASTES